MKFWGFGGGLGLWGLGFSGLGVLGFKFFFYVQWTFSIRMSLPLGVKGLGLVDEGFKTSGQRRFQAFGVSTSFVIWRLDFRVYLKDQGT